jgi:HAD superfamily hydrolase (TIGR01509 family)
VTGGKERIGAYIDSLPIEAAERSRLEAEIPAIHATKTENYTQLVREGLVPLREGVLAFIEDAERAGVTLAIATTTTLENIEALLTVNLGRGALDRFAVIGAAHHAPRKKPAPDIFDYVLRELQEHAADCVAIEDSANGLAAAKGAGLFTVITPSRWTSGEDFRKADLVLPSLAASPTPLQYIERCFRPHTLTPWGNNEHA